MASPDELRIWARLSWDRSRHTMDRGLNERGTVVTNRTIAAIAAFVSLVSPAIAATPVPVARGPLPVSATSYPFGAADHTLTPEDLKRDGYVEEEFLISGTGNVYDWTKP